MIATVNPLQLKNQGTKTKRLKDMDHRQRNGVVPKNPNGLRFFRNGNEVGTATSWQKTPGETPSPGWAVFELNESVLIQMQKEAAKPKRPSVIGVSSDSSSRKKLSEHRIWPPNHPMSHKVGGIL